MPWWYRKRTLNIMKILIVGQMVASKQGLEPLAMLLRERGHEVHAFLPGGKEITSEDVRAFSLIIQDGVDLVRASYADRCGVVIAGNPSVKEVIPSSATIDEMGSLRQDYDRVFLFVGASPEPTTAELELLIECLKQTKDDWCLVPAFHPKHAKAEKDGVPYQDVWRDRLSVFGDRIVSVPSAKNSDELAVCCDATFAAHSLTLISAVVGGRQAASLWTPASEASLSRQVGLLTFPLVSMGLPQIREVVPLDSIPMVPAGLSAKLQPFDPNVALNAILDLVMK